MERNKIPNTKIAIIGGGIQGLSLAYFLSKDSRHSVTLFERNSNLGGLLGLLEVNGTPLEGAYHHWFNYDVDIIELAKELGLEKKLLYLKSKMGLLYGDKIYPFGTPMDLLKFTPLSFLNRLRVGLAVLWLKLVRNYKKFEKVAAVDWLKKYMGLQAYEILWDPLLEGKFGDKKKDVTMTWMWSRLSGRAKTRTKGGGKEELVYPRGGFKQLIDAMAENIKTNGGKIRLSTVIDGIDQSPDSKISIKVSGEEFLFDKVFVTTPINVFLRLVKNLPTDYKDRLGKIQYRGAHVTVLVLNQPLMKDGYYWLNINNRKIPLLALLEHTNLLPKEDYGGKTVIYLGNYPDPNDRIMSMAPDEVIDLYCRHLPLINKDFKKDWIEKYYIFKDPAAQPVVDVYYKDNIPPYETPLKNLYLVTMAQIYPDDRGTSNAVKQAKAVIKYLNL